MYEIPDCENELISDTDELLNKERRFYVHVKTA